MEEISNLSRAQTVPETGRVDCAAAATDAPGWRAELELAYRSENGRTLPALRRHFGPLRVQKGLLPEGPEVWHQIVVHPPGGIAAGDELEISVRAESGARVLLTTHGASKWYRVEQAAAQSSPSARQQVSLQVASTAALEWLPMENIYFEGASARLGLDLGLEPGARALVFDLHCLGRPASEEGFERGEVTLACRVTLCGRPLFVERTRIDGGGLIQRSRAGLGAMPVFGMLIAFAPGMSDDLLEELRALSLPGEMAVTRLDDLLVMRWRGSQTDQGLAVMRRAWGLLRPMVIGRAPVAPRIWAT